MGAMSQHRPEDLNVDHESGSQYENRSFGERTPGPDGSRSHHDGTPGPDENRSYHEGTPSPDENRSSYGETQGYDDNRSFHEGTLQQENPNYDEDGMSQNSYANQCYHDDRGTPQNQDDEEMTEADEDDNSEVRAQRDLSAQLLVPLIMDLDVETGNAMFACGGSIPISESAQSPKGEHFDNARTAEPVTIRWDPPAADELARHAKLVLPLEPETEDNLERLIKDTEPASFGYKGKDVYNEDYRKALKMDTNAFATTVDPHSLGIIDTLAQVLRPTTEEIDVNRAVKAELYKLNVRAAVSIFTRRQRLTCGRSTPDHLENSRHTLTPLAATANSGLWLYVCHLHTTVASSRCAIKVENSLSTGAPSQTPSLGPPSTATVSTRFSR